MIEEYCTSSDLEDLEVSLLRQKEDVLYVLDCNGGVHIFFRDDDVQSKRSKRHRFFITRFRGSFKIFGSLDLVKTAMSKLGKLRVDMS